MKHDQILETIYSKYQEHSDFYYIKITHVNQKPIGDDTILHIFARTGAIDYIENLVISRTDINAISALGNTPLHQAAMFGQLKSVITLLKYRAKPH